MPARGLLLIGLVAASIPICFFRPIYGVVLWFIFAFLNPQSFTYTAFTAFPWANAVAIPTILGMLAFERRLNRLATREMILLSVLWIWFTVTTVVSMKHPEFAHHADATLARWQFVSKILLMTMCIIPVVHTFERLRYVVLTIAGSFAFFILKSFPFMVTTGGTYRLYGPEHSMMGDNTDFGLALNMTLPLYFCLAQSERKWSVKAFMAFLFVITIPTIFFTYSRGALVGLAGVFAAMLLHSRRRLLLIPVVALAVVVAITFAPAAWQQRMDLTSPEVIDNSAQSRIDAWAYSRALAADYPITGGGFDTFTEELFTRYWPSRVGTIYGPHSIYFQVLAEHGYVGLGLYLLLMLVCLATTRGLMKAARVRGDPEILHYAHMFQLSLIGFLISGAFLGRAYFDYVFTVIACVAIMRKLAQERWAVLPAPVHQAGSPAPVNVPDALIARPPLSPVGGR